MEVNNLSLGRKTIVGVQYLFVAFGATVLVPLLVGLNPSTALFTAGVGTFIFHFITGGKVPIFLGSSFAFIAPILEATKLYGLPGTLGGMVGVSLVYFIMSALVKWQGKKLLDRLFPPVVIGPVIILIGLTLSGNAVDMAKSNWLLATISLLTTALILVMARGFLKLLPVIAGFFVGYVVAIIFFPEEVDFSALRTAPWFALPDFSFPKFSLAPILYMIPVALAPVVEHIGDLYVVGEVAKKDFVKDPGLHRTLLGDGLACMFAGLLGGPPVTTYSEVTGAMSLTKVTDPSVIRMAGVTAIVFSIIGKMNALLHSIPQAVLGGIMLLLFGSIACVGVGNLINNHVDLSKIKNVVIISITLTTGIGGAALSCGNFTLSGIGLSAIVGVVLNLVLSCKETEKKIE